MKLSGIIIQDLEFWGVNVTIIVFPFVFVLCSNFLIV